MALNSLPPVQFFTRRWTKDPAFAWVMSALWLVLLCLLAFWWNLGSVGLIDETEPLFAEAARQMTITGDWITPYFNEATRFDKPPLVYWLMAIAYQVIGVNEWAVRFPSALSASALVIFGFFVLRRFGYPTPLVGQDAEGEAVTDSSGDAPRWWAAWIGAGMMALNLQTLVWARTGVSDMLLSGCMGSALFSFFWAYASPNRATKRWGYLGFYVLCALAVLTKGPVGIVIPGLIVLVFLFTVGQFRAVWREAKPIWGTLLLLAIALPWFILVIQANGDAYIDSFFGYHNVERFTRVVNRHSAPWFFYFLIVLAGFAPYSIYLPVAMARLRFWKLQAWRSQPRHTHLGLFALAWFGVIFGFFTIAVTKLPSYVLPLLPAAAILVALLWSDALTRPRLAHSLRLTHWISLVLLLGMGAVMLVSPRFVGTDLATPDFPAALWNAGVPITGTVFWGGAAIASLLLLLRRQSRWLWGVQLTTFILFILFTLTPALFVMDAQRQLPVRQMAEEILRIQRKNEPIVMIGFPKPSLVFYTRQHIEFIPNSEKASEFFFNQPQNRRFSILALGLRYRILESDLYRKEYRDLKRIGKYSLVRVWFPLRRYIKPGSARLREAPAQQSQ
ncbi:glycosyltransferase family 39 protein [Leptolyngbya sp. FACHB-8]|uniref:ArnT family glycosyltransferase n=1 Tax=unclassified Leptolyngbya TaxID=2650499 RepID=UPI001689358B|nr:glycosyltransferase family 39 protein [Leptolyngbya sp. FACHB-8]MBD1912593.1 glycosyltransferase family 39 protein [Leptolyngbya sp. FACHB-8]